MMWLSPNDVVTEPELPEGMDPNLRAALEAWTSAARGTWLFLEVTVQVRSNPLPVGYAVTGVKTGWVDREVIVRTGSQVGTVMLREAVRDVPLAIHLLAEGLRLKIWDSCQLRLFLWEELKARGGGW
jgi:hypothetical protein